MALVVQVDAGTVDNANSYVTAAEFRTYHGDRGTDVTGYTDAEIEQALIRATDYLDRRFRFRGEKGREKQRTAWPRVGVDDDDELVRFGIPVEVKEALHEYALVALTTDLNPSPTQDATGRAVQSKSDSVGPVSTSVTYVGGAALQAPQYPKGDKKLRGLVFGSGELSRG